MSVHFRREGSGFPVLLLHGTGSSLHTWDGWTEVLKDSFEIVRLDLPAYGLTGPFPDADYSYDHYIQTLFDFTERIGLDSFHTVGNSFGGALAFSFAGTYPDKVGKLILLDAAGIDVNREPPAVFKLAKNPILSTIMKKVTPKSFIRKNLTEVYADDSKISDELVNRYHDFATREGNRQAFIDRVNQPFPSIEHHLADLEEPTLIMWGSQDMWTPVEWANKFDDLIPDSRVIMYPGVGHVPMEESPEITTRDAMAFLLDG